MENSTNIKYDPYRHIRDEDNYYKLLKSGMFFEFHPELSGNWSKDSLIIKNCQI